MSSRGDDRGYKVVYKSRVKDSDRIVDSRTSTRGYEPERDYHLDERSVRPREYEYRDERLDISERDNNNNRSDIEAGRTRTTYKVGRDKKKSEAYLKRGDAVVVERPRDYGRAAEYEVIRPERNADGAYVVDLGVGGGRPPPRHYDYDDRSGAKYYDVDYRSSRRDQDVVALAMYDSSRGRDRVMSKADTAYKDVQVIEDYNGNDDPDARYQSGRGRPPEVAYDDNHTTVSSSQQRLRSSMRGRNDSPPEYWERKRSRSRVGFYRDQISHHDASESRHERPGAEAHIAGKYLVSGHGAPKSVRQDYDDGDDDDDDGYRNYKGRHQGSRRYAPQRMSDPRITGHEEYDDDKRTFTEDVMRSYEREDTDMPPRPAAYPPQRGQSKRRSRRHHDDDRSSYSEYEVRKRTEEYY
ncbi:hypothetical protein LTR72_005260 [Exophiala xenobiotica]|nr:hypothetical protein LTR72_005260 [Exophiala xenobiotica]KAK5441115.1 hypothetical protein LTR18_006959 [Exophiala xenobiotica]KAK5500171.1 hypothetical protein LTR55_000994 [Exophiala xenobiotica]KAK5535591.1 hypothetical protein LTR23_008329 [Chaetothyriales sp. CCFEE 6169]